MREVEACLEALLDSIHRSDIYQNYLSCEKNLELNPEQKKKVDDLRTAAFLLHQEEDWFEKSDTLNEQFAELRKKPEVNAYLEAELAVCKMIQRITEQTCDNLEIRIPEI